MIEGGSPDSLEQIDSVVTQMDRHIQQGRKVLAHCRGGKYQSYFNSGFFI